MKAYLIAAAFLLGLSAFAQVQPAPAINTYAVSPVVVATMIFSEAPDRSSGELHLLVLWRGRPGWLIKKPLAPNWIGTGGGRTPREPVSTEIHLGVVDLTLSFDATAHQVSIGGRDIVLHGDENVVLVGGVDTGVVGGQQFPPYIDGTLHVDPHLDTSADRNTRPSRKQLVAQEYIRRSRRLVEYLQCDAILADQPAEVQLLRNMCSDYGFLSAVTR